MSGLVYCSECGNDAHTGPCDPFALKAMTGPMGPFLKALLATKETRPPEPEEPFYGALSSEDASEIINRRVPPATYRMLADDDEVDA